MNLVSRHNTGVASGVIANADGVENNATVPNDGFRSGVSAPNVGYRSGISAANDVSESDAARVGKLKRRPAQSLRKNNEFQRAYRRGFSRAADGLVVYALKRHTAKRAPARIGISVSSKVGIAVIRNRIRRRIKEICRLSMHTLPPGYDIVIVARVRSAQYSYRETERDLNYLFNKLGLRVGK